MKTNALKDQSFFVLNQDQTTNINGGIGVVGVFVLGLVGTAIGASVDYGVKKLSGKSVSEHAWDAIDKVFK
jgi:hypothetical protein